MAEIVSESFGLRGESRLPRDRGSRHSHRPDRPRPPREPSHLVPVPRRYSPEYFLHRIEIARVRGERYPVGCRYSPPHPRNGGTRAPTASLLLQVTRSRRHLANRRPRQCAIRARATFNRTFQNQRVETIVGVLRVVQRYSGPDYSLWGASLVKWRRGWALLWWVWSVTFPNSRCWDATRSRCIVAVPPVVLPGLLFGGCGKPSVSETRR